jgi:hypothetical protein
MMIPRLSVTDSPLCVWTTGNDIARVKRGPLNRAELAERQRRLSMLSPHHVVDAYRRAHGACREMETGNRKWRTTVRAPGK